MDFNLDQYTIILLAINLIATFVGNAYYILRKKYKKTTLPVVAEQAPSGGLATDIITSPPPAPFASPEFVTEVLERV